MSRPTDSEIGIDPLQRRRRVERVRVFAVRSRRLIPFAAEHLVDVGVVLRAADLVALSVNRTITLASAHVRVAIECILHTKRRLVTAPAALKNLHV
jgi:hypothetical protein